MKPLNETLCIITGCLKPIPVDKLYSLAGIAPPHIRRQISSDIERMKQITDERHPMYNTQVEGSRLKSGKNFLKCTKKLEDNPQTARLKLWEVRSKQQVEEKLPPGHNNKWMVWKTKSPSYRSWTFEGEPEKMENKRWEGRHELCMRRGPDNVAPTTKLQRIPNQI